MKKLFCIILSLFICLSITSCNSKERDISTSLKLVDEVRDKYNNILQQIFYNEKTGEFLLKEYTYTLQNNKWVCIEQRTNIFTGKENNYVCNKTNVNPALRIFYNSDLANGPITIMDNEYAKVSIVKYLATDNWWEFGYELKIYNKTNKVLSVLVDDTYIMDIQCKPLFNIDHIEAGKTAYFQMAWDEDTLTRCHIPYVDNVEFIVKIFDNEDWTVPALAGTRLMIKK